ncbi:isoaspartyl peptidase/L-asparaginase [Desulfurococcaceae archaeon MEX13E-LK6-19]|nr:isoaspartyl peptidase/L-asparaginase [Desulfurococcaceae archaeon MEX13E-LK6-19]
MAKPILLLHGGAGRWRATRERIHESLKAIAEARDHGYRYIETGSALEAVVEAVAYMEDSGAFNAGIGSVLNFVGEREMDAGVMDGVTKRVGAVAAVTYPKNPVKLARLVMEKTEHVILAGRGADFIAEKSGLPRIGPIPERIVERYNELIKKYKSGDIPYYKGNRAFLEEIGLMDTVGAVAVDKDGRLAAAVSTGGVWLKLPGRVGDSPIPGAGFYADENVAIAATGLGEAIVKTMASLRIAILVSMGYNVVKAGELVIDYATETIGPDTIGVIAVDKRGRYYIGFNTEHMMVALKSDKECYAKLLSRSGVEESL